MNIETEEMNLSVKLADCPICGRKSKRNNTSKRKVRDLGIKSPKILDITYSKHKCLGCNKIFSIPMRDLVGFCGRYSNKVKEKVKFLISKKKLTLKETVNIMKTKYYVKVPMSTLHDWYVDEADF